MTVLLMALGGVLAAAGTRIAAVAFIAAAVFGARTTGPLAIPSAWTAALAAGFVLLDPGTVRRLGRPALGATAALAAGWATNGAVVALLWVCGTAAAVLDAIDQDDPDANRWAVWLCLFDLPVIGAIASAAPGGFEGWPVTLSTPAAFALLVAAVARMPLLAGSSPSSRTLLVVRTQIVVLALIAIGLGGRSVASVALIAGSAAFATALVTTDRRLLDAVQELGLYLIVLSATGLGWVPRGWAWGALAAGTLIHHLRLTLDIESAGQLGDMLLRAGVLGLPFLPVIASVLEGSAAVRGWETAVVATGLVAGMAGRARSSPASIPRRTLRSGRVALAAATGIVMLTVVAGLSADAVSLPRPPAGSPVAWPPLWASIAVAVGGLGGALIARGAVPKRAAAAGAAPVPAWIRVPALPAGRRVVVGGVAALVVAGAGMWIVGLTRGFL